MAVSFSNLQDFASLKFDEVIDVRSPSEYAKDHIAGAINLPVLSDAERAQVGTVYKQDSPFKARKLGAALVAQNAARHLQTHLADKPGSYKPLVYCWRGGQRSNAFASILSQIGWRADVVQGGYKSYRRLVVEQLYDLPFPSNVIVLDGDTGSGKTDILKRLPQYGWQVLDLEALARHRGSVLGGLAEEQPTQKAFESALAAQVVQFHPAKPVIVEAESSKVGGINIPPSLWDAMCAAPRVLLHVPKAARARYLVRCYQDLDAQEASERLEPLLSRHGAAQLAEWRSLLTAGDTEMLAQSLIALHYDPLYRRSRRREARSTLELGDNALDPGRLDDTARVVSDQLMLLAEETSVPVDP